MAPKHKPRGREDFASQVERLTTAALDTGLVAGRGLTPREVAARLRVSAEKVRSWIVSGKLAAVNTADAGCGKPRFVIMPEALSAFERSRSAAALPKPVKRRRPSGGQVDFFPGQ